MKFQELESLIEAIERQQNRLKHRQQVLFGGYVFLIVILLCAWRTVQSPAENVRARSISIVDANGVSRILLGAPVPNPVVNGKAEKRRSEATAIIFNDAKGNERGGFGMLADGSMNLCFDDASTERNCLFFVQKIGNGVALNDDKGNTRALLYLDPTGAPHLILHDASGHDLVALPPTANKTGKP